MLLVVFGAGASYDSVPSHPPSSWRQDGLRQRPPLANDLFDERELFAETASRLHQMLPILPRLRHPGNATVEVVLRRLQTEGEQDHERYRQLTAVRYYLHYTLGRISADWLHDIVYRNGSNYHTLLDHIRHHRTADEQVNIVTFNYDTLLETALQTVGVPTNSAADYIAHNVYKVFKLHGSVRWAHPINTQIARENRNFWEILGEIIRRAPELEIGDEFVNVPNHLLADVEHTHLYPAITIPLREKGTFECPSEHVEALRTFLPHVTRMLIVGWSATEAYFLQLLAERLPRGVQGLVVCDGGTPATIAQLRQAGIDVGDFRASEQGFSQVVLGKEIDDFLQHVS